MSAINALILADKDSNNTTFDVNTSQEGLTAPAVWLDKTAGVYSGFNKITQLVKRTPNATSTRVSGKITMPVLDVATSQPIRQAQANISFALPDSGSREERENLLAYTRAFVASATFEDAVLDMNPAY